MTQNVTITVPSQTGVLYPVYYIGYKMSAMAIDQYSLYSNTDQIQTVTNANFEWFSIYNSINDEAKENSDCFATLHKN